MGVIEDSLSSTFSNVLSSVTGYIPKAVLCVRKPSSNASEQELLDDADMLRYGMSSSAYNDAASNAASRGTSLVSLFAEEALEGTTYSKLTGSDLFKNSSYVAMQVQYNPSSISIHTHGQGPDLAYAGGNLGNASNNQLLQMHNSAMSSLQFQIYFDAVNIHDAFMMEGWNLSVSNMISSAANLVTDTLGSGYSVRTQMDGLMGLLTQRAAQNVLLFWGEMSFRGRLARVENTYTMFNTSGEPVRGTTNITIRQLEPTVMEMRDYHKKFDEVFKDVSEHSGMSSDSLLGNWLG